MKSTQDDIPGELSHLLLELGRLHQWYQQVYALQMEQSARSRALLASQFVGTPNTIDRDRVERESMLWGKIGLLRLVLVCRFFHAHYFFKQYPLFRYPSTKKDRPTVSSITKNFPSPNFRLQTYTRFPIFWSLTDNEAAQGINDAKPTAETASAYFKLEKTKQEVRDNMGKPHVVEIHTLSFLFQADLLHGQSSLTLKPKLLCASIAFVGSKDPQIEKLAKNQISGKYVVFVGEKDPIKCILETIANLAELGEIYNSGRAFFLRQDFLSDMVRGILNLPSRSLGGNFDTLFAREKQDLAIGLATANALRLSGVRAFEQRTGRSIGGVDELIKLFHQKNKDALAVSEQTEHLSRVAGNFLRNLAKRKMPLDISNKIALEKELDPDLATILKYLR